MSFKPMLAPNEKTDINTIVFPVLGSAKLDGIRALKINGKLMSRNLKEIPNAFVQKQFANVPDGFDGELIQGDPTTDPYRRTVSAVMSEDGEPEDVRYYVFDSFHPELIDSTFNNRFNTVEFWIDKNGDKIPGLCILEHFMMHNLEELLSTEEMLVTDGYEGMMVRSLNGPYKQGRATLKQGWLLKIKRFEDAEAIILDTEERMHNGNEATTNALGRTERSSHKAGMSGRGDLGKLLVRGINGTYKDVEFAVGGGFNDAQRDDLWKRRKEIVGKIIKYKFFPVGSKDKPRFPVWLGWRDKADM